MRSLMLAGGGVKVGFQAGVLQVWLDEAGVSFDHVDGASGGCLNLAMYCEGRSGRQIADAWRDSEPLAGAGLDLGDLLHGRALFSMDRYRENVLRGAWGLDWAAIRSSQRLGTFNLCNFTRQQLGVVENSAMDEDRLVSAISADRAFKLRPGSKSEYGRYVKALRGAAMGRVQAASAGRGPRQSRSALASSVVAGLRAQGGLRDIGAMFVGYVVSQPAD